MKCFHCGEQHTSSKCPALSEPLKDGFYSGGGGGGGGHSHEDDERTVKNGFVMTDEWKGMNMNNIHHNDPRSINYSALVEEQAPLLRCL